MTEHSVNSQSPLTVARVSRDPATLLDFCLIKSLIGGGARPCITLYIRQADLNNLKLVKFKNLYLSKI